MGQGLDVGQGFNVRIEGIACFTDQAHTFAGLRAQAQKLERNKGALFPSNRLTRMHTPIQKRAVASTSAWL